MRKWLAILCAMCVFLMSLTTLAEDFFMLDDTEFAGDWDEPPIEIVEITSEEFGEFVVGATTKLSGDFFTNMWGNNTCDIDVRSLLHGLETVYWTTQPIFDLNPTVIVNASASMTGNGDKEYILTFAEDLLYNDGTPIDARDYAFTFLLHSAPQIAEIDGTITNYVHLAGWEAFSSGEVPYLSGVRLLDNYTLSITVKSEYLPFFFELGMIEAVPYPISVIAPGCEVVDEGNGVFIRNIDESTAPIFTAETLRTTILDPDTGYISHPMVTSGPWELVSFDWETRELQVKINENFKGNWEGQKPVIDNIRFKSVLPVQMVEEMENGDVHLLNKVVSADDINALLSIPGTARAAYPRLGFGFINYSCEMGPSQFQAVRQAIAYALDITAFNETYVQYYGMQVYGYYGIGQWMLDMLGGVIDTEDMSEEHIAAWESLSLDGLNPYDVDLSKAEQLLIDDGWTLNESGAPYVKGEDEVRAKMVDGELMTLRLKFGKMEDSVAAELLDSMMVEPLGEIGIRFESTEVPFVELLQHYYRQTERTYDFMYLATNFIGIFDPYFVFNTADEYQGHQNTTGFRDEELERLALELRQTQPGAYLEYLQKWIAFQENFNEKLPMLPLYSNIYFDVFTDKLQNYNPDSELYDWPVALLYATLGELVDNTPAGDGIDLFADFD